MHNAVLSVPLGIVGPVEGVESMPKYIRWVFDTLFFFIRRVFRDQNAYFSVKHRLTLVNYMKSR